ncbi:hypothetical protein SAMN04515656_10349 [Eubacterium aggregans]|uniref:Uncharacterized protein n=1 Tax=Eubacterium aggregans TaxID=81409 RepID=A0A1H3Y3F1_9FIRM|nr:hypothetical protein [Eubacterium aggregans]SEA06179.1 hypothetical protein SAMN04515656_10349 [Eubacterium aggregans]
MYTKDLVAILTTTDGKTYTLDKTKLLSRTFTENSSSASDIALGYCAAKSYTFALNNLNGQWDDVILTDATMVLSVVDAADETGGYKIGKFYVETAKKENGAINITSTDAMTKFDTKFMGATYPCTIGHLVQVIADQLAIDLITPTFTNSEFTIKKGDRLKGASCRNILALCCELAGCFAQITADEELQLRWYDFSTMATEYVYSDFSKFVADETPTQITGVRYYLEDKKLTAGNDGNAITITANDALFDDADESDIQGVLDNIYNEKIKQLGYLPCNFTTSDFRGLKIGDAVRVTTEKGQRYVSIVTQNKIIGMMQNQVLSVGKSIIADKGYTQAVKGVNDTDIGDKIGYVLGYNLAAYTYTDSAQTLCAVAVEGDNDTRVDTQLLLTYEFTPTEPEALTVTGDVAGAVSGTFEGVIDTTDTTAVSGTQTGDLTGTLTGAAVAAQDAPLITIDYRMDATVQCRMYQRPHPGANTFSAAFIPITQKGGTVSHDVQVTVAGGQIAVDKRGASISLLVKNGTVIDTPPWPEINITQTFNPIVVNASDDAAIKIVDMFESITAGPQVPTGGIFTEIYTPISVVSQDSYIYVGSDDNLLSPYWQTENLTSYNGLAVTSLLDCTLLFNGTYQSSAMGNIMFAPQFEAVDGGRPAAWDTLSMMESGKIYQMDIEVISGTLMVPEGASTDSFNIALGYASAGNPAFLTAKLLQGEVTATGTATSPISNLRLCLRQNVSITADNYKIKVKITEVI